MKTINTNSILKITLMVGLTSTMVACGSKSTSSTSLSSTSTSTNVSSSGSAWASCNKASGSTFTAQNKAWIENGKVTRYDFIKAKMTLPESFLTNGNYIQMYRWKANSSGQTYLDSTPLQFRVITNAGYNVTNYSSALSWSGLSSAASSLKLTTAASFFAGTQFVVDIRDQYAEFDAIKIVIYNSSNQLVDQVDMLIPVFAANPAKYAVDSDGLARATVLKNLHPMKSMLGQTWSEAHYQTIADGYCF